MSIIIICVAGTWTGYYLPDAVAAVGRKAKTAKAAVGTRA